MVDIPKSKQLFPVATPVTSSGNVPQPSITRILTAGTKARGVAGIGDIIQKLGATRQAADDNLELEGAKLNLNQQANDIISQNSASIQDPVLFEQQTNKDIARLIKTSAKGINRRNADEFGLVTLALQGSASKAIRGAKTAKMIDLGGAQRVVKTREIMGAAAVGMAAGDATAEQAAVNNMGTFLQSQVNAGIISVGSATNALITAQKDVAGMKFDTLLVQGKVKEAKAFLDSNTLLTASEKLEMRFKSQARINKIEKKINDILKAQNKILEGEYIMESLVGGLEKEGALPGDVQGLTLDTMATDLRMGKIDKATFSTAWKNQQRTVDAGGMGDEALVNELLTTIADDLPDNPIIDDGYISRLQETDTFNTVQERTLRAAIAEKRSDIEGRLTSPSARLERDSIKRQYRVTGLLGSRLLKDEALRKFDTTMNIYNSLVKQGTDPVLAKRQAFEAVGPVPGRAEISENALIRLKEEERAFGDNLREQAKNKVKKTDNERINDRFAMESFQEKIINMEAELRLKKEVEALVKTQ